MVRNHIVGMYRSRFRSKNGTKGNREDHGRKRHRTNIYTNRSNQHVIDRMIEVGKGKWETNAHKQYEEQKRTLKELEEEEKKLIPGSIDFYTDRTRIYRHKDELLQKIQSYEESEYVHTWDRMTELLYKKRDQNVCRLIYSNKMMNRPTETFYMDPDRCPKCMILFKFDSVTNTNLCSSCGLVVDVLFISEDNSQDTLVTKQPNSGCTMSKPTTSYQYVRSPLYRRYLNQFSDNVDHIPLDVMRVLYKYLSNIHLQNSIRCRPTPVANILRTYGFAKWANYSIRITNIFNGEPNPILSDDLIKSLVGRFEVIFSESTKRKQKLPSFAFITNILLRIEGHPELGRSFVLHKTRNVLRRIYNDVRGLIETLPPNEFSWDNLPDF